MKSPEAFHAFYENELRPQLQLLDAMRKKKLKAGFKVLGAIVLPILLTFLLLKMGWLPAWGPFLLGGILLIVGLIITVREYRSIHYQSAFKEQVIRPIVQFVSPDLSYHPKKKIPKKTFEKSRIFLKSSDRYQGDDLVEGTIDATDIAFSELKVEYKTTSSKGETRWHTIFDGLFFVADFHKDFEGSTILVPNYLGGGFSFFKKVFGANRKEGYVQLEDPEFQDNFSCYSTDDITARYILSPALMQRLNDYHKKYPKERVSLSFVDGNLYIAILNPKNYFEPRYFRTIVKKEWVESYFDDLRLAVETVEDLNLNRRIWDKQ